MSIFKDGKVFIGKESAGKQVGTYEIITVSESPIKVQVKGNYDTGLAPQGGGGDALHSFENRTKDDFGGAMNSVVNSALTQVYNKGINPFVSSITVDMGSKNKGPVVKWEVIITESPDGKAWVGLSSRGGAGGKSGDSGAYNRAKNQTKEKKAALPGEVGEPDLEILDVLDYQNEAVYIRQIMFQYTKPKKYPPHPKSGLNPAGPEVTGTAGGTGTTGSSASAAISGTPSIALNIVFPENFEIKAREPVPAFTIWVGDPQPMEEVEGFTTLFDDGVQLDEFGNPVVVPNEYVEAEYAGTQEDIEIRELNAVDDEPTGVDPIEAAADGATSGTDGVNLSVDVEKSPVGSGPSGGKLLKKEGKLYYLVGGKGLAGHRLTNIVGDLQKHLIKSGYANAKIGNNGIMRDLVASTYPNSPARATASLHGAGLAIDVTFTIPGKKWKGIGDNGNLASDASLTKVIWNFVKAQGDITWGAEWDGSKPWDGVVKGRGVIEYHHFEIKSSLIADYWKPFEKEVTSLGFNYKKLNTTGKKGEIYKLNKALLNSVGIA